MTKEERFLIESYKLALEKGNPHKPLSTTEISMILHLSPRQADSVMRGLFQANFLKKEKEGTYSLTPLGVQIVKKILPS